MTNIKKTILGILGIGVAFASGGEIMKTDINTVVIYQDMPRAVSSVKPKYIAPIYNYDNIQFASLRKKIDNKYTKAHDVLSSAYYNNEKFVWNGKDYGKLDKDTFQRLQEALWARYEILFHTENLKQEETDMIQESEYNIIFDNEGIELEDTKAEKAIQRLIDLKRDYNIDIDL